MGLKAEALLISWHAKQPVFTVDVSADGNRVATGGGDNVVRIWRVTEKKAKEGQQENETPKNDINARPLPPHPKGSKKRSEPSLVDIEFLTTLSQHLQPVNCVRFSPDGKLLATGSDDGWIFIWRLDLNRTNALLHRNDPQGSSASGQAPASSSSAFGASSGFGDDDDGDIQKEVWVRSVAIHAHKKDVYDLCWSPDAKHIISGSTDNTSSIWNVETGKSQQTLADHTFYVQGVSWDPRSRFIATQSNDRTVRIYQPKKQKNSSATPSAPVPGPPNTPTNAASSNTSFLSPSTSSSSSSSNDHGTSPNHEPTGATEETTTANKRWNTYLQQWVLKFRPFGQTATSSTANSAEDDQQNERQPLPLFAEERETSSTIRDEADDANQGEEDGAASGRAGGVSLSRHRLFLDDVSCASFFRRLTWSIDGSLLLTPSAMFQQSPTAPVENAVYVFVRNRFQEPIAILGGSSKPTISVRCCPVLFSLLPSRPAWAPLRYRMIFAVASKDEILFYDTQHTSAIARVAHLHFASLSDISWFVFFLHLLLSS